MRSPIAWQGRSAQAAVGSLKNPEDEDLMAPTWPWWITRKNIPKWPDIYWWIIRSLVFKHIEKRGLEQWLGCESREVEDYQIWTWSRFVNLGILQNDFVSSVHLRVHHTRVNWSPKSWLFAAVISIHFQRDVVKYPGGPSRLHQGRDIWCSERPWWCNLSIECADLLVVALIIIHHHDDY